MERFWVLRKSETGGEKRHSVCVDCVGCVCLCVRSVCLFVEKRLFFRGQTAKLQTVRKLSDRIKDRHPDSAGTEEPTDEK